MKIWTKDADGRADPSWSFITGATFLAIAGGMYVAGWGDAPLQIFFAITGLIPLILGFALTPARP